MAKKGSAQATIGLDYSAFEAGAKAVMKIAAQMGSFLRDTLAVAAGNILANAFSRGASAISSFFATMRDRLSDIFATGESMANLAHATGMATGEYMKFSLAASKGISMSEAAALLGKNADIMQKDAGIFRDVSLKLYAVGERIQGFWLGVADKIAPVLMPLLDRLMSLDLTSWGQAFAEPIANAVGIIYQLAVDGQLWQTMGELAAAAFRYAGEILGKVIAVFSSYGFTEGLAALWDGIKSVGAYLYQVLQNALSGVTKAFAVGMLQASNTVANIIDGIVVSLGDALNALVKYHTLGAVDTRAGLMDKNDLAENMKERDAAMQNLLNSFGESENGAPTPTEKPGSLLEEIQKAINSTTFGSPELLDKIQAALDKFQKGTVPNSPTSSNNSFLQNFGVSSLAAVGGGGGVAKVSLMDHAAKQTDIQDEIKENVKQLVYYASNRGSTSEAPPVYYSSGKAAIR